MRKWKQTDKPKRAPPFSRAEIIDIVKFLDEHNYKLGKKGQKNQHKSKTMAKLSDHLFGKYGQRHSCRRILKRFSDLKVREKSTLEAIRRHIKRDAACQAAIAKVSTQPDVMFAKMEQPQPSVSTENTLANEEFVTNLDTICPCHHNPEQCKIMEKFDAIERNIFDKMALHHNFVITKIKELEEGFNLKFEALCQKIDSLKEPRV
ncbi:uncharacterized protein LOC130289229 isoform X2 [Hyla sarda]|uniref:uncharacterized protein LOC130289229 isoform X2 n=1 Tax=Hyla sarda TaxID=327740 RepID=UPI0024C3F0F1|nr:uncharacterized protein LOC130289229 isoform X2 [Hyla sarda]